MRDEFPVGPFIFMVLTIAVCSAIGLMIGSDYSDLIGVGLGLVLGIALFGVLTNLPTDQSESGGQWRMDLAHRSFEGPRRWWHDMLRRLKIRR